MAENFNFKVSYVRITDDGLERHNNVMLDDISIEERKDVKSLIFLPINSDKVWDISGVLQGFPILEYLYLPSTMTIKMQDAIKECPMLKSLLLLTANNVANSLDQSVVKVNAQEEEGDNTAEFRTFVTTLKDGREIFEVNAKQVQNRPIVITVEEIKRLTQERVEDYISGEQGIMQNIDIVNSEIEDERCKIDISADVLRGLLSIFVEKGVTSEEFDIDFVKLYDKIESYKGIMKNVNQVTIKEEVEGNIVEAYQGVLKTHYENLLNNFSKIANKLCSAVTLDTESLLVNDLMTYIVNIIIDSPEFPADDYKDDGALTHVLDIMPTAVSRYIRSSKERGVVRKYLQIAVSNHKNNRESLINKIDARLKEKTSLEDANDRFVRSFGLEPNKKQTQKLAGTFVSALVEKNFGVLTKADVNGIINKIKKELRNGEVQGRALLDLITNTASNYPTENEIKEVLVDFIAENGYSAIKFVNA